jgi:amidase
MIADNELWNWTATKLARAIRSRAISSREVVKSCLGRIEEVNPTLNALVEVSEVEALADADKADQAVARGEELGPLHGVPVSIKINSDQRGHATTHGVVAFKTHRATEDSPHVANLRRSGAVFVGRSNAPAFSYRWFTNNDAHGRTLNPWSSSHTPGGSSGGAAAAVASGMVPIAHGNDIGGSIRYPAYACGVAGIRPTAGRVPGWYGTPGMDEPLSIQTMLVNGPLARSVGDLRLALTAMSCADTGDPLYAPVPLVGPSARRPIRVGVVRDVGIAAPNQAVNAAVDLAKSHLNDAGYLVEEIDVPVLAEATKLWWLLAMEEFRPLMPLVAEIGDASILQAAKYYYEVIAAWWGNAPTLDDYMKGYGRRGTLIVELAKFMERYPLIMMPTSAEQAFEEDADITGVKRVAELIAAQWSMMAIPLVGFPALSVPTGVANRLPLGVQLLAQRFREDLLFDASEVIEARCGTLTPINPG